LERQTFWQTIFYLGAFYLMWPILLASQLSEDGQLVYPFMLVVFTLAPLQGFLNFLVYARPRFKKLMEQRRNTRRQLQQASKNAAATPVNTVSRRQLQQALKDSVATSENTASRLSVSFTEDDTTRTSKRDPGSTSLANEMIGEESDEVSVVGEDIGNKADRIEEPSPDAPDVV
jgi:hypothetical protein